MSNHFNVSIIVKTFLRPHCLSNFLFSIRKYQEKYNVKFAKVVIVDDSDDECRNENKSIIEKYTAGINIKYLEFEFNVVGVCKGRNIALDHVGTELTLVCDDDFMLDLECDLSAQIELMKLKECDILGGYYRDIEKIEDYTGKNYAVSNWIGFSCMDSEDTIFIVLDNYLPEYTECHTVQTFFVGKTSIIKEILWNEEIPLMEHVEFFDRAKYDHGAKVAFSRNMFVRHYRMDMKKSSYNLYRNKDHDFNYKRKFFGVHVGPNHIRTFDSVLLKTNNVFKKQLLSDSKKIDIKREGSRIYLKLLFVKIELELGSFLSILKVLRLKETLKKNLLVVNYLKSFLKLRKIKEKYPEVLSIEDTVIDIVENKKSLIRYGDGEFKLILGEDLGNKGSGGEYQLHDQELALRLKENLAENSENLIVGIVPFTSKYNDKREGSFTLSYFEQFWLSNFNKLSNIVNLNKKFGNALVSRVDSFYECDLSLIKKIWNERKVLFVIGKDSHFVFEEELFSNIDSFDIIYGPNKNAFLEFDNLISKVSKYAKDYLVLISLGPTATVLSAELSKMGYQSIDIGHMPNCYAEFIGRKKSPEEEHWN